MLEILRIINLLIILATLPPVGVLLFNTCKNRTGLPQKIKEVNTALLVLFTGFVVSGIVNILLYLTLLLEPGTNAVVTNIKNLIVHAIYLISFWIFYFTDRKIRKEEGGECNGKLKK